MSEIKIRIKPKGQPEEEFTGTDEQELTEDALEAVKAAIPSTTVDYHVEAPTDEVRERIRAQLRSVAGELQSTGRKASGARIIRRDFNEGE